MANEKHSKLNKIAAFLTSRKIEGLLVTHPPNVRYLSGFSGGEGVLLVLLSGVFLLVDARYTLRAIKEAPDVTVIETLRPWEEIASRLNQEIIRRVGVETAHLTVETYKTIRKTLKGISLKSLGDSLDTIRIVKDTGELAAIRRAIACHTQALHETLAWISPSSTEREWSIEFAYRARRHGADGLSFETIVASGPRSATPHAAASGAHLDGTGPVVFDHGVVKNGYCSDETATFFLKHPSKKLIKIYDIVRQAHDLAIASIRPGLKASDIDKIARERIAADGFGDFFTHGTGHGVGLEIHERPYISYRDKTRLREGMVFTVEPGIYIRGVGGVRIEDMILVTGKGCKVLTKRDKSLTVIFD